MTQEHLHVDVLIIGAGPAGLTAAAHLASRGAGSVLVLEREPVAGGIPRHSDHLGYGMRDLHRFVSGPAYANTLVGRALNAGAQIETGSMVTGWAGPTSLDVTSVRGRHRVTARAVILATGARERPRTARLVPGDRPAGVLTTGQLQNLVHVHGARAGSVAMGTRAVVVGAELVSWSAVLTLRGAGVKTILMTTTHPRPESYLAFNLAGRLALRVPVATGTRVSAVIGRGRVEAVQVQDLASGACREIPCDTVVFTGDWIPDHELARSAGLQMDPGTSGPLVDSALRTSAPGVFAAGNLLHPVDTADVAALDGARVADTVVSYLAPEGGAEPPPAVRILVDAPLSWISPGLLRPGDPLPARGRYLLWTQELIRLPRVSVRQDGRLVNSRVIGWPASPGRVFRLPASMLAAVDPNGGDVRIGLHNRFGLHNR